MHEQQHIYSYLVLLILTALFSSSWPGQTVNSNFIKFCLNKCTVDTKEGRFICFISNLCPTVIKTCDQCLTFQLVTYKQFFNIEALSNLLQIIGPFSNRIASCSSSKAPAYRKPSFDLSSMVMFSFSSLSKFLHSSSLTFGFNDEVILAEVWKCLL